MLRLPSNSVMALVAESYPRVFSLDAGVKVTPLRRKGMSGYSISRMNGGVTIEYAGASDLMRAIGSLLANPSLKSETVVPAMEFRGFMLDVSRNGVMLPDALKKALLRLSLLGMNKFCLYTEDTYEVKGHPLVGYRRGKYTKSELRALDRYAASLGIEMFPCIQTLGHMEHILKFGRYSRLQDTARVISAVHPETRQFIETLVREASAPYKSRLIHVGMDETQGMGLGRAFKPGVVNDPRRLYLKHVSFVAGLCARLGLQPMMWGDIIEGRHSQPMTKRQTRGFPANMRVVYWDYYKDKVESYSQSIAKYREMGMEPLCSPGIWNWHCLWPVNGRALHGIPSFLTAAKESGIREMMVTAWGDDGQECPFDANWPALCLFADGVYESESNDERIAARMKAVTGLDYDTMVAMGGLESLPGVDRTIGAPGKLLLWEDPLAGRVSHHLGRRRLSAHYRAIGALAARYRRSAPTGFLPLLKYAQCAASVLEIKADLVNEARSAYRSGDRAALRRVSRNVRKLAGAVEALRVARRNVWFQEFKPFGWEVLDNRFGGLLARLDTMKSRLDAYLRGELPVIAEFDEKPEHEFDDIGSIFVTHSRLSSLCNVQ